MYDFLISNPWVVVFLVPIVAVVGHFLHAIHRDSINADLKRQMIQRGMPADEIIRVLEAGTQSSAEDSGRPNPR